MATEFIFDGKKVIEPGVYSRIQAQGDNPPFDASYGDVLIIDTGHGAGYGVGSGINGTLKEGKDAISTFDNLRAFKNEVRGGTYWKLSENLFRPNGFGFDGISKLHFVKAAQTTPAEINYSFTGGLSIGDITYTLNDTGLPDTVKLYELTEDTSGNLYIGAGDGDVYQSTDNGLSWTGLGINASSAVKDVVTDSSDNIYALTNGDGVYQSTDGGSTWTQINSGLGILSISEGVVDSSDNVYVATDNGVYKYDGSNWSGALTNKKITSIAIDTADNIYATAPRDNVYKSTNSGSSWVGIGAGLDIQPYSGWLIQIFVDSNDVIFVSRPSGLYRKGPNDAEFINASTGINEVINSFSEETGNGIIYASSNSMVYRSTDGGFVWEKQIGSISTNNLQDILINSNDYLFLSESFSGVRKSDNEVGGTGNLNGGSFVIQVNNEGGVGNGSTNSKGVLTKGYAGYMRESDQTSGKYVIDFYAGKYKGADTDGDAWDFIPEDDYEEAELLTVSPEFDNIQTLIEWANENPTFLNYFTVKTTSVQGTGQIDSGDLNTYSGYNMASGGTEVYGTNDIDEVLANIDDLNYTFILSDNYGTADAKSSFNDKLLNHVLNEAKFDKFIFIGGGQDRGEFDTTNGSVGIAEYFDSDRVHVVHGDYKQLKNDGTGGMKRYSVLFKTASILGRTAGLEPQTPITFKSIDMSADIHVLSAKQRRLALQKGIIFTKYDNTVDKFIVELGVNTIQNNQFVINRSGNSYLLSFNRVAAQMNKLLKINARISLFDTEQGPNVNTIRPDDLREFTADVLQDNIADENNDDLIISYKNVNAEQVQDAYEVTYEFQPNLEINKIFFTGKTTID